MVDSAIVCMGISVAFSVCYCIFDQETLLNSIVDVGAVEIVW